MASATKKPVSAMPAKKNSTSHRKVSHKVTKKTITTQNTTAKNRVIFNKAMKIKTKSWKDIPSPERRRRMNAMVDELRHQEYVCSSTSTYKAGGSERVQLVKAASTLSTPPLTPPVLSKPTGSASQPKGDLKPKHPAPEKTRSLSKRDKYTKVHKQATRRRETPPIHAPIMSSTFTSLRGLATRLFAGGARPSSSSLLLPNKPATAAALPTAIQHQQTASYASKGKSGPPAGMFSGQKAGSKKSKGPKQVDPRIINILRHFAALSPKRIPPPLRFGRNRYLRHWTIHRAWLLFRRQQREQRERILMQQHQSMSNACEELRNTEGPGTRETGYLYRVAMLKNGVYGLKSIPIEYASRALVETPGRQAWNHEWKR
ncbi:hypothetical protein QR685DRAFT_570559 [Neurospora intermedia]|uniref:Uncharacterized protein n=1 Tax=Neurospora intermedia TaxID=5142 RepID=A0ABR3DJ72_NEUIN